MKLNNTLLVLDTETGGLDPTVASLMEIAVVVIRDGKVLEKYSSLVKSKDGKYVCNDFARKVHGITDEQIEKNGKLPIDIIIDLNEIKDKYFDGQPMTIVAHNAAFDISFVKQMFVGCGLELCSVGGGELEYNKIFSRNAIDTATMALVLRMQNKLPFERCSLDNITKFYGLEFKEGTRHTALSDAEQTAKAFMCMFEHLSGKNYENVGEDGYDIDFDDSKKINESPTR